MTTARKTVTENEALRRQVRELESIIASFRTLMENAASDIEVHLVKGPAVDTGEHSAFIRFFAQSEVNHLRKLAAEYRPEPKGGRISDEAFSQ